ncbi:hemerythrin domain-containing protein [Gaoshiqia sediminis]|uniref:Hemerythrin domain-containing protein n=1 Tax=Gaoshiqia sediminis TaxID=2986998 RepID=A0AA42C694_9BACT|nr:hemerythrin domain-containing protein [Gaoshiqia sediminis]MCW0482299.1 hemerythrin domain-containing protein [Gaoshiqia sediminis]
MENITNELSKEHQYILKVIDAVMLECDRLVQGKDVDENFFQRVISFIQNYADGYHHVKEEDILFKAMLRNMVNTHCNPIPVMLHEHDAGREFVTGMKSALVLYDKEALIENARRYGNLLRDHIFKEDNVLYEMAEEALNDSEKKTVNEAYAAVKLENFIKQDLDEFVKSLSVTI